MPEFNPRIRAFMAPVRRSSFRSECNPQNDASMDNEYPEPPYDYNVNEYLAEENDYYNKIQKQPRSYYARKHKTIFIKTFQS
jgi:hypothetical protein